MFRRKHIFIAVLALVAAQVLRAQSLEIAPKQILVDETAVIRASGLQPGEHVTIRAELEDGAGHAWSSEAEFAADAQGTVDVSKQAPVKGSYKEISAMGLVWSMRPSEKGVATYVAPRNLAPQSIQFSLVRNGAVISSAQLEQDRIAAGVRRINVEGQLHGILFLPDTTERRPGVLVLGGSEGGLQPEKAAWLASRGFAAFALAYFHYENLPSQLAGIPLEYFVQAINWMAQRPEILPDHIGVMGTSRGGELALILGSAVPQIKAVVAYVPANFVYPACCGDPPVPYAWTWRGRPLTYVPRREIRNMQAIQQAAIKVEQTKGPILMISGKDDGVWDSANMADAVVDRLKHAHFAYRVENLKYPHAGHRSGRPEIVPTWHGKMRHPVAGTLMDPGGNPEGDANSTLDAIPRVLDFLKESLQAPSSR